MASLLDRKLIVLTGKGGVGKTTISAALGPARGRRGLRTIVVEMGEQRRLAELFGRRRAPAPEDAGARSRRRADRQNLWSISIDPDQALLEWLQSLGGRVSGRVLASSGTFQYFAAAAPGAKELISMVKIWKLTESRRAARKRPGGYDLVILDAPATGHALGMLHSPQTFGAIARVGPIASQTQTGGRAARRPRALRLPGCRPADRDGRHRDDRAPGRSTPAARPLTARGRPQRHPAPALLRRRACSDRQSRRE